LGWARSVNHPVCIHVIYGICSIYTRLYRGISCTFICVISYYIIYWRRCRQWFVSVYSILYYYYIPRYLHILYYTAAKGVSLWRHARTYTHVVYCTLLGENKNKTNPIYNLIQITVYRRVCSCAVRRLLRNSRSNKSTVCIIIWYVTYI